ncbi:helix-turn-helix transcriptional regulator [Dyella sp.]|jgi:prophage regulatory protein|uniref:helix-turn-helix transcriptional regulator n=1 Tax=Dyella sp. TaxID=1869338 RepID=UPI002BD880FC|nr:AlpA family phage regulatory protein [Dyella sp.]HTC25573.1 AlpA family phage regulatory protein [Dyella sp.]
MSTFLTEKDVLAKIRISKSELCRLVKAGKFPSPIKLSPRCKRWVSDKVEAWMNAFIDGNR